MPHDELDGLEVGAYTLERPVGHGGMGSVWLAHRTDGRFEGRVAVKLMNLALVESLAVERFRREGSLLARLTHPGIARLLDAGVAPTRQPYLVIEYIDGQPIDQHADLKASSVPDRLELVLQVLDALTHAHANLVVHRDIKPTNILVTTEGTVKLLDFGIGKLLDQESGEGDSLLTAAGGRAFTPAFAAPEQVLGGPITTATDIYSVGVLAYLLVAGRHPLAGPGQARAIPALSDTEPGRIGLGDLDSVLLKAMRRAPAERYQTAQEFADDLRRYLGQRPVRARPDSVAYRMKKFLRRHRAPVTIGAVVVAVLMGMAAFALQQMTVARAQRNAAIRSSQREGALSELQGILAADLSGPSGEPLSMGGRIAKAEEVLRRRYRNDPWLVATVMVDLSGQHFEVGDLTSQRDMLERARGIARQANLGVPLALANCTRAINFWLLDILDSARADIAEAKALLAGDPDPDLTVRSICLEAEGKLLQSAGQADQAVALLKQALAIEQAEPNGGRQLSVENSLAEVLRLSRRTREAVPHFRHILIELEANGYGDTDAWPNVVAFLAASLEELGELKELNASLREFVRTRQASAGGAPIASRLALLYGVSFLRLGALDSANWWIEKALEDTTGRAGLFGAQLPTVLSQLRLEQGRLADARVQVSKLPSRARGQRASAAMLRAQLRRAQGDADGASQLLELELAELLGDTLPKLALFTLPLVTAGEWRLAKAEPRAADSIAQLAEQAAAIDSLALTRSALVGRAELLRARALAANRELVEARKAAERAVKALDHGYGSGNGLTQAARELVDSLSR